MEVKEKILELLLQGEKSTGELAEALGYLNERGIRKYNDVTPSLNTLYSQGLLSRSKKKKDRGPGPRKTYWKLKKELQNISKIWVRYPAIQEAMLETSWVIKAISKYISKYLNYGKKGESLLEVLLGEWTAFDFFIRRIEHLDEIFNRVNEYYNEGPRLFELALPKDFKELANNDKQTSMADLVEKLLFMDYITRPRVRAIIE